MSFSDKTVIVTGAGRGIGETIARTYAKAGAYVLLADVEEKEGNRVEQEIEAQGGQALFVHCDVSLESDIIRLMETAESVRGTVDILINNAGIADPHTSSFYEMSAEQWDRVMNTNARGAFFASREAAKRMRRNKGGGAIVNISSTRHIMSEPDSEAYAASKGAIASLTHAMAATLGPDGIRVNCISPGWIETGDYGGLRESDHNQHPAGRVGRPDDIARACLYLTAEENDFVTGTDLVVDGGMTRKMIYEP